MLYYDSSNNIFFTLFDARQSDQKLSLGERRVKLLKKNGVFVFN
jgi:hypothetical protein